MPRDGRQPEVGLEPRACAACSKMFQPYRSHQIACSRPCRDRSKDQSPRRRMYAFTCKLCGAEFEAMWTGMGRQPSCEDCTRRLRRESQERKNLARSVAINPDRRAKNLRDAIRRYGITYDEYIAMRDAQGNRCKICGDPPDPNGRKAYSRLHVDHHHGSKNVRALLCGRCNQGLGFFLDDPERLLKAAAYLKE